MFELILSRLGFARGADNQSCSSISAVGPRKNVTKWTTSRGCRAVVGFLFLCLVTIVIASVTLSGKTDPETEVKSSEFPETPSSVTEPNDILENSVRFVKRINWAAQPPSKTPNNLTEVPAPYVIISHTATETCETQSECVLHVRVIQTLHIESFGYNDIAYNFLVGGDCQVYVGRDWNCEGAHAAKWNKKSIGISFIGTFNDAAPFECQLDAAAKLIRLGEKIGEIARDYKLLGHRQVSKTLSPGQKLYDIIRKWEHWSPLPSPG